MKNGSRTRSHVSNALALLLLLLCITHTSETHAQSSLYATRGDASAVERPRLPAAPLKRLMPLRGAETPEGSRVRISSDGTLADYKAFRQGGRFYVLIPHAAADFAPDANGLSGRGFADARVERRGADVLISFALRDGATARVTQNFNRLDVLFSLTPQTPAPVVQQQQPPPAAQSPTGQTSGSGDPATPANATPATPSAPATANPSATTDPSTAGSTSQASASRATGAGGKIVLPPEKANPIRPARFERPPVIDGKLDDEVWARAAVFKDFYQISPGDNTAPSLPTKAFIGYDSKHLYLAFDCTDEPGKVRATIPKRDDVFGDDTVRVFLDTFNDKRKAYVLA
ncbi:MAG TPA: sugar-binding protein, partial [Pyrinomonadaceae bacterium]